VTTIFGFLPTLAAGQVRPAWCFGPTTHHSARRWVRTLLALAVIILALSFVASVILGSFPIALGVTIGAFIAAGFLTLLLSFLIWLIGGSSRRWGSSTLRFRCVRCSPDGRADDDAAGARRRRVLAQPDHANDGAINSTLSTALGSAAGGTS